MKKRVLQNYGSLAAVILAVSCAESARENIVDPVNAPTIEMSTPVLDGSSVLIEWRYLVEGDTVTDFLVRRLIPGVPAEDLGRVLVGSGATSEFRTATFRDTTLIAGVRMQYEVVAFLRGGVEGLSVVSSSIRLDGTRLESAVADPDLIQIVVSWADPPAGTIGFDLLRRTASGGPELVFATDDLTTLSYVDTSPTGNTSYSYVLSTRLDGGASLQSPPIEAGLFTLESRHEVSTSSEATPGVSPGNRTILSWTGQFSRELLVLFAGTQSLFWHSVGSTTGFRRTQPLIPNEGDYEPSSLSILGGSSNLTSLLQSRTLWTAGLSKSGGRALINVSNFDSTVVETSMPASGGGRTGLTLLGTTGSADRVLFFEGTVLRELDDSLRVLGEIAIEFGEPLDIDYLAGSIWLAYSDRLMKSNPAEGLEAVTSWQEVTIPNGIQVTATTRFGDRLVILDGIAEKVYLMDLAGGVLLNWDALGERVVNGDITTDKDADFLYQADGEGVIHVMLPAGVRP